MRKVFNLLLVGAALLLVAACAKDSLSQSATGDTSTVTFTVKAPSGVQTRSYSDGTTATNLYYALYQTDSEGNLTSYLEGLSDPNGETYTFTNLETTISLQLINGNYYSLVLWAQDPEAGIFTPSFTDEGATLTISTDALLSCTEAYDGFYKYHEIGKVTGDISGVTIELTRPFAQINFGTDDLDAVVAAGVKEESIVTSLTVTGVYDVLDLITGEVSISDDSESLEIFFDEAALPSGETFPVDGYDYVSMNYVLYAADKGTVDLVLEAGDGNTNWEGNTLEVSAVPVQRNYRTNIYGSLFTSTVDYTIVIEPAYEDQYDTLLVVSSASELIDALGEGDADIALGSDIGTDEALTVDGNVTIELGSYTLASAGIYVSDDASLTIEGDEDGSAELQSTGSYTVMIDSDNATVNISNVSMSCSYTAVVIGSSSNTDATGNTVTLTNVTIDLSGESKSNGAIVYGAGNTLTLDGCTITSNYMGITQNGTGTPGGTFTVTNSTITALYSGIYISSNSSAEVATLTVTGSTITSQEESALEVKKTNLTVSESTLIALNEDKGDTQYYALKGNGSNGYGYGITLAGYTSGTAYEGAVSLSDVTYEISATYALDGTSPAWNVCYYNGTSGVDYATVDGASDGSATEEEE